MRTDFFPLYPYFRDHPLPVKFSVPFSIFGIRVMFDNQGLGHEDHPFGDVGGMIETPKGPR